MRDYCFSFGDRDGDVFNDILLHDLSGGGFRFIYGYGGSVYSYVVESDGSYGVFGDIFSESVGVVDSLKNYKGFRVGVDRFESNGGYYRWVRVGEDDYLGVHSCDGEILLCLLLRVFSSGDGDVRSVIIF